MVTKYAIFFCHFLCFYLLYLFIENLIYLPSLFLILMKESIGEFRKKAQSGRIKSIQEDYYRFFSAYISWFFVRFTSLTGNKITFIWVIVGLLCVVFYTLGSYKFTLILGLFALYGYYLCDLVNISIILHKPGSKETIEKHNVKSEFISSFSFKARVYRFIRFITFVDYFHVILLLASVFNILWLFLIFSVIGWNFLWIVKVLSEIYIGGDY